MHPLEAYLHDLHATHATGAAVKETSYYGALQTLLNEVGKPLKPRVRCVLSLKNTGAGIPDGGLFTADQFESGAAGGLRPGQLPARGAVEIKGPGDDVRQIVRTEQVRKYLAKYGQVLVTNYRDFVLVGRDASGAPVELEAYSLAAGPATFWAITAAPAATVAAHGEPFVEYLKRVMLSNAPLAAPADLAWFLASYARDARARVEKSSLPALANVRAALEEALGLRFQGAKGDHFFRSTLVQTLFYGIFSAWVLWSKTPAADRERFDWHDAGWLLHVPMISALFEQVATRSKLTSLGLIEVLDWTGAALNRVDRAAFFRRFEEAHAVQYFYEPFLEAFDPELRKDLGVWYTPPEIVRYMVARVDAVLRSELGIAAGLADPNVYVLDPACGTGAYLVEVLRQIHTTQQANGADAFAADDLKAAAMGRVFGFEILPAPFVIAHLQLGLLLQSLGAPLDGPGNERAGVYLTNALTGWEPPKGPKQHLLFPEMEQERDAAEQVKQATPILVVVGNPPYNGFAGVAVAEERVLTDAYRTTKRAPAPQGQGLNDLYVRFYRMAERRIAEQTKRGIVCFISNYSWLDGLSFTGMRERYLEVFNKIWIDNLHGDRVISEYAPDGRTSETVFAMNGTSPGIKIGTAIALMTVKDGEPESGKATLYYRDMDQARAAERRAALLSSLDKADFDMSYTQLQPVPEIGLPFKNRTLSQSYLSWPLLPDLFPASFPGIQPSRDDVVVDIDRDRLVQRMEQYFNPNISDEEMRRLVPGAMEQTARFDPTSTRQYLVKRGFLPNYIVRYSYRPFDARWLYWEPDTKLLDEKRAEYYPLVVKGNIWLAAAQRHRRSFDPPLVSARHSSRHIDERGANLFPLWTRPERQSMFFMEEAGGGPNGFQLNLSPAARTYLTGIGTLSDAENLFYHTIAILHTPAYIAENAGALLQDWPRVPLPATAAALRASAALGRQVAALLDTEHAVPGVTGGPIAPALQAIGAIRRVGGGALDPAHDLAITAGWGHAGQGGVTMPGKGRAVTRAYTAGEQAALGAAAALLGATTLDLYLNPVAYWENVPAAVWDYTIGGYQVLKKWLSYREAGLLGRPLSKEEARDVTHMARRIAAILLLTPALDANYAAVKAVAYAWPTNLTP